MTGQTDVLWFIPTHGDGRYLGSPDGEREISFAYLRQIAQAADQLGFEGVLLPTGSICEEAWITAAMLAPASIPQWRLKLPRSRHSLPGERILEWLRQ